VKRVVKEIFPTVVILNKEDDKLDLNSQKFLDGFGIVKDEARFAQGWEIFCRNCGKMATTASYFLPCMRSFVLVSAACRFGCSQNRWRYQFNKVERSQAHGISEKPHRIRIIEEAPGSCYVIPIRTER